MRKKSENKKGFTLAELLIVVAIIAVLVAIAIPVFSSELEKSREAVDVANIRAAYAEAVTEYLSNGLNTGTQVTVKNIKQTGSGWKIEDAKLYTLIDGTETPVNLPDITYKQQITVKVDAEGKVSFATAYKSTDEW